MAKRKTRQQKITADARRSISDNISVSYSLGMVATKPKEQALVIKNQAYPYLTHDLTKTAYLTAIILSSQLILYYLLTNHVLKIPGLGY